jgi:uncharacterized damage-inducible protein DinB
MIDPAYARAMAAYNQWQNTSIYGAADTLDEAARRVDRGAFFGSIEATLNHILWGDRIWMSRFSDTTAPRVPSIPQSVGESAGWSDLKRQRIELDEGIIAWTDGLTDADMQGDLSWMSGAMGREVSRPRWLLITHMFNHQTHHRGQVHAMLTAAGATPDDTDLPFRTDD